MEMVVSLILVGILSGIMAIFMQVPMQSYFLSRQRLDLSDSIEPAMRHMDDELRQALPNSVRIFSAAGVQYMEFLATRASGRYRAAVGGTGGCAGGNELQFFPSSDTCFTTIGQIVTRSPIAPGVDYIVIGNKDTLGCPSPTNAYCNGPIVNKSLITAYAPAVGAAPLESRLRFNNVTFNNPGPSVSLFYVVSGPVMYSYDPAAGQLMRYSGYPISAAMVPPPVPLPAGATSSIIASHLMCQLPDCDPAALPPAFTLIPGSGVLNQDIVSVILILTNNVPGQGPERVTLQAQIPVSKTQ